MSNESMINEAGRRLAAAAPGAKVIKGVKWMKIQRTDTTLPCANITKQA